MEILSRDNLIDTLKFMISIAEDSPKESYFVTNCEFAQVDADFQKRSHDMGLARALKLKEEADKKQDNI